jgi:uncharacterized protein YcfL
MTMKKYFLFFVLTLLLASCVSVQEAPNIVQVSQTHTRIAIMPITATLERKIWMNQDKYNELCRLKSEETQQRLYRQLSFYGRSGTLHAELMSPDEVNSILFGAGYPNTPITNNDLCSLLHVDALVFGNIQVLEPISEATAIIINSSSPNFNAITNIVTLSLSLYDAKSTEQIWNGQSTLRGQYGSIKENMQRQVIRRVVRNLPYNIKKRRYKKAYQELYGL